MENNSNFVKYNNQIIPKPQGSDYSLINNKVYTLKRDRYSDDLYLEEADDFKMPEKYYQSESDKRFIKKVIKTFKETDKNNTGVLLSGLKGSGKTLMAKYIASQCGVPIIVVDKCVNASDMENFFIRVREEVVVIFDELDKYWNTSYLLGFLDGVKQSSKKLVLCTCNDEDEVSDYLNDRCSRIRYKKVFDCLSVDVVVGILSDVMDDDKAVEAASYLVEHIDTLSYDNVIVFRDEVVNNPEESYEEILEDLNIETK